MILRYARWMSENASLVVLVVLVGGLMPFQSGVNAMLGRHLGHPVAAAMVNFAVGGAALILGGLVLRVPFRLGAALSNAPAWAWLGGLCGASLVLTAVFAAPRLGASLLVAGLIAGQLGCSVVLDHFGLVGYAVHPLSVTRALGLAALAVGVYLIRQG